MSPDGDATAASGRGARRRELGDLTRVKILDTAQGLFAVRGIDAVSVNEICKVARVNTAAVHYHFGSKAALIRAINQRGIDTWAGRRAQLIDELEASGNASLHDVVRAMVIPVLELVDKPWGLDYVRFLSGLAVHPEFGGLSTSMADEHTERFVNLLAAVLPHLPRPLLLWRYTLSRVFLYQALSLEHGPLSTWLEAHGVAVSPQLRDDFVSFFVGALGAPHAPPDQ